MRGHAHIVEFLLRKTQKINNAEETESPTKHMKAEEKNRMEMEKLKRTKAINEAILWEQAIDVDE